MPQSRDQRGRFMADASKTFAVRFVANTTQLNRALDDLNTHFGKTVKSIGLMSVAGNALPAVTTSLKAMSGAAGVLPGIMAALGTGFATVKLGTLNFAKAVEKGNEELAKLSPNARAAAVTLRNLKGEFDGMQKSVQNALFKDLNKDINALAKNYLPVARTELSAVAAGMNEGTRATAAYLNRSAQVATITGIFQNTRVATDELSKSLAPLTQIIIDVVAVSAEFLPGLSGGLSDAAQRAADFVSNARQTGQLKQWISDGLSAIGDMAGVFEKLWHLLSNLATIAGLVFQQFTVDGKSALDIMILVTDEVIKQSDWLIPLIAGFYALSKALLLVNGLLGVFNIIAGLSKVAIRSLIASTGIGLLIIAFVTLWETTDGFGNFWKDLWRRIVDIAKWAWDNILKPTIDALVFAWNHMGEAFDFVWTQWIKPVIDAIGAAAMWLWNNAIQPAVDGIAAAINFLMPVFEVVGAFISFTFSMIKGAAEILWAGLKVVFDFIGIAWDILAAAIEAVWVLVIEPIFKVFQLTFEGLGQLVKLVWETLIKPVLDLWGVIFQFLWDNFLKPLIDKIGQAWDAMGQLIKWSWENVIKPVLDFFESVFQGLQTTVENVVAAIKKSWDTIAKIFGTPVKWVVDVIWNAGIVKFWNWLAKQVGLSELSTIDTSGWPHFAEGGRASGAGGPKDDKILAWLSNGEYVMPAEQTAKYLPQLEAMRAGRLPGFALGGVVGDVLNFIGGAIGDAARFVGDPVGEFAKAIGINNEWARGIANLPVKVITSAADFLWKKITELVAPKDTANLSLSELASRFRSILMAAIKWTGVGEDWLGPLSVLIQRESGWNPRAINLWDSNAKKGTPSKGLMQTIDPTFQRYRDPRLPNDPFDPMANIVAGINYIKARYGTIFNVQQANPNAAPRGYDTGGWLPPGYTTVYNGTGEPELVLNKSQYTSLGRNVHYHLTVYSAGNSEINLREQFRKMELMDA